MTKDEVIEYILEIERGRTYSYYDDESAYIRYNGIENLEEYLKDKEFVLDLIKGKDKDGKITNFPYIYIKLDDNFKRDPEILNIIIHKPQKIIKKKYTISNVYGQFGIIDVFKYIPEDLKVNHKLMKKIWTNGRKNYNYDSLPEVLKNDVDICIKNATYQKTNSTTVKKVFKINKEMLENSNFLERYIEKNDNYLIQDYYYTNENIFKHLVKSKKSREVVLRNVINVYNNSSNYIENNKNNINEEIQNEIKKYKHKLEIISTMFNDKEAVKSFFINYKYSIIDNQNDLNPIIKKFNKNYYDKDFWNSVVISSYPLYKYFNENAKDEYLNDIDIHINSIKVRNNNLELLPEKFRSNKNIIRLAIIKPNILVVINHINDDLKNDKEFIKEIIKANPQSIDYLNKNMYEPEYLLELLNINSSIVKYKKIIELYGEKTYEEIKSKLEAEILNKETEESTKKNKVFKI